MSYRKQKPASQPPAQTPLSERSAEELAVLAQRDNLAAYGELVSRYEGRLFNFLLRRVARRVEAEDLTQEAFVRAWERIGSYDPTWRFSTWLFTIASRLAVSEHRKARPKLHIESAEQVSAPNDDDEIDVQRERDVRSGSQLWELARIVLREEQHTALWLRYAEDMGIGEIAKVMGKSHVGVRVALFRSRQTLAAAAAESGIVVGLTGVIPDSDTGGDNRGNAQRREGEQEGEDGRRGQRGPHRGGVEEDRGRAFAGRGTGVEFTTGFCASRGAGI